MELGTNSIHELRGGERGRRREEEEEGEEDEEEEDASCVHNKVHFNKAHPHLYPNNIVQCVCSALNLVT